jgi:hypothetical protein
MLDLGAWPSVSIADKWRLPQEPGIYALIDADLSVQYVGQALNLKTRWSDHGVLTVSPFAGGRIAYQVVPDASALSSAEADLIRSLQPPLNVKGKGKRSNPGWKNKGFLIQVSTSNRLDMAIAKAKIGGEEIDQSELIDQLLIDWLDSRGE